MERNLTMMTDLYQLTMMYGHFVRGSKDEAVFDLFFREPTGNSTYAIVAGLEQAIDYIKNLHFSAEDVAYLEGLHLFSEEFLQYLREFSFTGDLYAIPEGTPVFPGEPLLRVKAPVMQAQLVETALLTIVNHQTLIATKANRVCYAAGDTSVMEFGLRRAQGPDAGIYGARAAMIGGCVGTSNVLTGQMFDIPVMGTHGHSWVMSFDSELEAFRAYAKVYPDECLLLVDTYDVIRQGIPNAITVFKELRAQGHEPLGIRIDSGDLAYLSKKARKMLDDAGWTDCKISVSNSLDEYLIQDMLLQGAQIDMFGVGERLITAKSEPVFGGVYKLVAVEEPDGTIVPKIKVSENVEKITVPHFKKVYRFYGRDNGKALADYMALHDETVDDTRDLTIFDPLATWKKKRIYNFEARELLVPVFLHGKRVYDSPPLPEIREYCRQQIDTLWDEVKRFDYPHKYYVDLSDKLWDIQQHLLRSSQE